MKLQKNLLDSKRRDGLLMNKNYIIIGDSITYGIGDFESGGWATMFKNYIVNQDD